MILEEILELTRIEVAQDQAIHLDNWNPGLTTQFNRLLSGLWVFTGVTHRVGPSSFVQPNLGIRAPASQSA